MSRRQHSAEASRLEDTSFDDRFGLLMSIQPRFASAILEGTKTVELRRKPPRDQPSVVIIYGSGTVKAVLGVAQLKEVHTSTPSDIWKRFGATAGVSRAEFNTYFEGTESASALELTNARRSDANVPLSSLRELGLEPPQSWRYVDRQTADRLLTALGLPLTDQKVRSYSSLSWSLRMPMDVPNLGLEAATRLNRPLLWLVGSARCFGVGGVGGGQAAYRGLRRSAPRPKVD